MHDALARERRPVRDDQLLAAAAGERRMAAHIADARGLHVGRGQHREHARRLAGALELDRADARERMRRAHEPPVGLVRLVPVGDEMAGTAHQRVVLDARMMVRAAGGL